MKRRPFQVRSAFTGVDFTTFGAESVVDPSVRLRIIRTQMLIGNAGVVSAMASPILTFVGREEAIGWYREAGILLICVAMLWAAGTSRFVDRQLQNWGHRSRGATRESRYATMFILTWLYLRGYSYVCQPAAFERRLRDSEMIVRERDWLADNAWPICSCGRKESTCSV